MAAKKKSSKSKSSTSKNNQIKETTTTTQNTITETGILNNVPTLDKVNSAIPYSTVASIVLLALFKRDHLVDIIEMGSDYFNITFYQFIGMIIFLFLLLMGIIHLIFSRIKYNAKVKKDRIIYLEKSHLEREALITFFKSTGGIQWNDKTRYLILFLLKHFKSYL
jgi:hypothetical protein